MGWFARLHSTQTQRGESVPKLTGRIFELQAALKYLVEVVETADESHYYDAIKVARKALDE